MGMVVPTKCCSKCGLTKPTTAFSSHPTTADRLFASCKACENDLRRTRLSDPVKRAHHNATARERQRRVRAVPRIVRPVVSKTCTGCGVEKSAAAYYRHPMGLGGLTARCRSCEIQRAQAWQKRNPERAKAADQRYMQGTGRAYGRARRALSGADPEALTDAQWRAVCEAQGHCCLACGAVGVLTIDHVRPISLGGRHRLENIQGLCLSCNSRKCAREIDYRSDEWEVAVAAALELVQT